MEAMEAALWALLGFVVGVAAMQHCARARLAKAVGLMAIAHMVLASAKEIHDEVLRGQRGGAAETGAEARREPQKGNGNV